MGKSPLRDPSFTSNASFRDQAQNNRDKYISYFYFLDTEKINRIDTFLRNNKPKQADIICDESIVRFLGQELPTANYKIINLDEFIEKDIKIYD